MSRFYLQAFFAFGIWKTIAVTLHYFSASPWGGPLVLSPDRLLPDTLFIEWGLLGFLCLIAAMIEPLIRRLNGAPIWRALFLVFLVVYCSFGQLDREVVRWLGQHMSLSYIRNYWGARDGQMTMRIFADDVFWTSIAGLLVIATPIIAWFSWKLWGNNQARLGKRTLSIALIFILLTVSAHQWFRPSEKRWRRIRPAVVSIVQDSVISVLGLEKTKNPTQAAADLTAIFTDGTLSPHPPTADLPHYPFWRDDNVGTIPLEAFRDLPLSQRPDIVFVVFETYRGWNSGLVPHPELEEGTPELNAIFKEQALYFPYTHSTGFPSVEGCMGIHLSLWPHFRKIFLSDFAHIHSKAFPEILREAGYQTSALLGADPSFSNFTPWIERWYGDWEYQPAVHHDGPLVDRFIERYEAYEKDDPRLMLMWTATTHPPYDVPESEGIEIAGDNESRYNQAIRYTDKNIARLIRYLQSHENWERTIVVVVGDHAQPTPEQWRQSEEIGDLTPGHTWTVLSLLGGWEGLPAPRRVDSDISHIDIAPTLLSILNLRSHNHFLGRDLRELPSDRIVSHPVVAFRYGDIAWLEEDSRTLFRLDSDNVSVWNFDRENTLQYGMLPGDHIAASTELPPAEDMERRRDAIRYYSQLLDENRLMPRSHVARRSIP